MYIIVEWNDPAWQSRKIYNVEINSIRTIWVWKKEDSDLYSLEVSMRECSIID